MRRVLIVLLAGFALAFATFAGSGSAPAVTFTIDGKVYSSDAPIYTNPLEPLPSGAQAEPDKQLPHSNTPAFILLGAVALTLIAALAIWLTTMFLALEPRWVTTGRHAFTEAGWRASNTWDEFKDWVRLGR